MPRDLQSGYFKKNNPMNWYAQVMKKYADFEGRARRTEFWMFYLINLGIQLLAALMDYLLGTTLGEMPYGVIYLLYGLAVFVPSLAVSVRRMHDIGRSGLTLLLGIVPVIGAVLLLLFALNDSQPGENKWGPNPKEALL